MGLLEDAIREHLDLKRKHGAPEQELERQEVEALGPARRELAPEDAEAGEAPVEGEAAPAAEQCRGRFRRRRSRSRRARRSSRSPRLRSRCRSVRSRLAPAHRGSIGGEPPLAEDAAAVEPPIDAPSFEEPSAGEPSFEDPSAGEPPLVDADEPDPPLEADAQDPPQDPGTISRYSSTVDQPTEYFDVEEALRSERPAHGGDTPPRGFPAQQAEDDPVERRAGFARRRGARGGGRRRRRARGHARLPPGRARARPALVRAEAAARLRLRLIRPHSRPRRTGVRPHDGTDGGPRAQQELQRRPPAPATPALMQLSGVPCRLTRRNPPCRRSPILGLRRTVLEAPGTGTRQSSTIDSRPRSRTFVRSSDAARRSERWEWTPEEIRSVGHRVVDLIADHLSGLPDEPVFRPFPNDRARAMLDEPLPEQGAEPDAILDRFAAEILPHPFGNGHPRFFGWVNGPPVVLGVLAEALAAAMNPSVAGGNHAATYVERQALNWLKQLVGLDRDSMGLLVSGGSAATLIGLAAARHRATGGAVRAEGVDGRLVVYTSDQGHSAIRKAVELLGLGERAPARAAHRRRAPTRPRRAARRARRRSRAPVWSRWRWPPAPARSTRARSTRSPSSPTLCRARGRLAARRRRLRRARCARPSLPRAARPDRRGGLAGDGRAQVALRPL